MRKRRVGAVVWDNAGHWGTGVIKRFEDGELFAEDQVLEVFRRELCRSALLTEGTRVEDRDRAMLKTRYFRVVELECFEQFQQGNAIGRCNSQHPGGEQFRWKGPGRDRQLCGCESCAHRETRRLRRSAIEINDSVARSSLSSARLICSWPHRIASAAAVSMSHPFRQVEDSLMNLRITKL